MDGSQVGPVIGWPFPHFLFHCPFISSRQDKFWIESILGELVSLSLPSGPPSTPRLQEVAASGSISSLLGVSAKFSPIHFWEPPYDSFWHILQVPTIPNPCLLTISNSFSWHSVPLSCLSIHLIINIQFPSPQPLSPIYLPTRYILFHFLSEI